MSDKEPKRIVIRNVTYDQAREMALKDWESGVFDGMGFHEFCKRIDFRGSDVSLLDAYLEELIELRDK